SACDAARKDRVLRHVAQCFLLASGVMAVVASGSVVPASAQGRLEAHYSAKLAGIPIGKGSWDIDASDTQYVASVNGATSGLLRAFTGGEGSATVRSTLNGGRVASSIYVSTITSRKKADSIHI